MEAEGRGGGRRGGRRQGELQDEEWLQQRGRGRLGVGGQRQVGRGRGEAEDRTARGGVVLLGDARGGMRAATATRWRRLRGCRLVRGECGCGRPSRVDVRGSAVAVSRLVAATKVGRRGDIGSGRGEGRVGVGVQRSFSGRMRLRLPERRWLAGAAALHHSLERTAATRRQHEPGHPRR